MAGAKKVFDEDSFKHLCNTIKNKFATATYLQTNYYTKAEIDAMFDAMVEVTTAEIVGYLTGVTEPPASSSGESSSSEPTS